MKRCSANLCVVKTEDCIRRNKINESDDPEATYIPFLDEYLELKRDSAQAPI